LKWKIRYVPMAMKRKRAANFMTERLFIRGD
jgi:hypothetical protein